MRKGTLKIILRCVFAILLFGLVIFLDRSTAVTYYYQGKVICYNYYSAHPPKYEDKLVLFNERPEWYGDKLVVSILVHNSKKVEFIECDTKYLSSHYLDNVIFRKDIGGVIGWEYDRRVSLMFERVLINNKLNIIK
jgi:hypothetical protein